MINYALRTDCHPRNMNILGGKRALMKTNRWKGVFLLHFISNPGQKVSFTGESWSSCGDLYASSRLTLNTLTFLLCLLLFISTMFTVSLNRWCFNIPINRIRAKNLYICAVCGLTVWMYLSDIQVSVPIRPHQLNYIMFASLWVLTAGPKIKS